MYVRGILLAFISALLLIGCSNSAQPEQQNEPVSSTPEAEEQQTNEEVAGEDTTTEETDQSSESEESTTDSQTESSDPVDEGNIADPIQLNNEKVKDASFMTRLAKGEVKGLDVTLEDKIKEVEALYGKPDEVSEIEGGYKLDYVDCTCGFGVDREYKESKDLPISSFHLPIRLTLEEVKQAAGEPTAEGVNEMNGSYHVFYDLGTYQVYFEQSDGEASGLFESLTVFIKQNV